MFTYYVLNYNFNAGRIEKFNIFCNWYVAEQTELAVKKYIRSPSKYTYKRGLGDTLYGFDALCKRISDIIMCEEWGRCEYEISVGRAFEDNCNKLEKWDCFRQCEYNMEAITREVLYQYRKALKKGSNNE